MTDELETSDEQVLLVVHKHWASFLHDLFYIALPAFAAFTLLFLISSLPQTGVDSGIHVIAAILFPGCLLAVVIMAAILWSNYYLDMIVVTDRRLFFISQISLTKREVLGWNLHEVAHVDARQDNFLETFFNFGTLNLRTSNDEGDALIEGVPNPEYVCAIILKQDDRYGELKEATIKQKELLKFLSHEVKGHLTKSKAAFAAIIEGDYGPVTEPLAGMAHSALEDTQRGVETVMSILDNASLESGEVRLVKQRFDLSQSVQRMVEEFRASANAKKLSLVSSVDGPCFIDGDQEKIERHVIRNFIDNAIRYTPAGQVDVMLERINGMARVSVSDTGVGISEIDMQKLFTQGGHGEHSRDVNPESTGYGLFIAKQIVERHGGRVWARSAGAKGGSTFFAEFPLV
ncbi:MAG: HAMP domain-containing sensor histidine kinase [Candidatus Pacebacteria bacterium]|nr:HAMP domain-containing sensor histidine kinase [Candidatus Paceibacterota bacterium]